MDDRGTVTSVRHDTRRDWSYLRSAGEVAVTVGGRSVDWSRPELSVDADEVEIVRQARDTAGPAGQLQTVVRHTFGAGWGVRLAVVNPSTEPVALDRLAMSWVASDDAPTWALAADAVGSYAVFPPDGRSPVLGGTLGLGALESATPVELRAGPVTLAPGGRYVVQWHWGWFRSTRELAGRPGGRHGDRQVPRSLQLTAEETAIISAGDDEALVLPPGLHSEPVRDQVELSAVGPGTYGVEVRSARGVTRYDLHWVEPVDAVLTGLADQVLAGPRTAAGIVRLGSLDAATIVQFALRVGLGDAEAAEEALDLFTARLGDATELVGGGGLDPRTASYLCGEFDRTGDVELLEAATAVVLAATTVTPGLGLAAGQVGLARVLAGLPLTSLTEQLAARLATLAAPGGAHSVADQAAALELAVLARTGPATDLPVRIAALGGWLGAGLKGHPVRELPVDTVAHLAAVFAGLSEEVSTGLRRQWRCTGHELGRWTEAAVLSRLAGAPVGPAHFWLAAAARMR